MLIFVIPIKSRQVSKSWERVSKLFERCIRSVCNQNSTNFRVIVVCHEKPQIEFSHPYITYIEVGFPAPEPDIKSKRLDKERKILVGLNYARQLNPSHIMNVDADDCVSRHLAEFVEQNSQSNGWFVNRGYLYQYGSKSVFLKRKDFYLWCGTCNILRYNLLELPEIMEDDFANYENYYFYHRKIREKFSQKGTPIEPLPFAGAVYTVDNGDNIFGSLDTFLKRKGILPRLKRILFNVRPLTLSVRDEFSLYNIH